MANSQGVQVPGENLIPVFTAEIGGVSTLAVNARDLHGFLGVKRDFSAWIKSRITDFGFVKNQDLLVSEIYDTKQGRGGNKKSVIGYILQGRGVNKESVIEYILTLDMAKELSMVERSEKGRIVRKYFIECERKLHEAQRISEQDLGHSETEIKGSRETEEERLLNEAILDRILFWTLEKRDAIFHPGVDRRILFLVTKDIFTTLSDELFDEAMRKISNAPTSTNGFIEFINEWVPAFFRERQNVA